VHSSPVDFEHGRMCRGVGGMGRWDVEGSHLYVGAAFTVEFVPGVGAVGDVAAGGYDEPFRRPERVRAGGQASSSKVDGLVDFRTSASGLIEACGLLGPRIGASRTL
jgi:hypothetical protein